jgi:hypothetical protein
VNTLSYCEYEGLLEEGDVRDKIAMRLIEGQTGLKNESIKEVSNYIRKADKDLFLKLKDGVYTLDQLKARIAERKNGVKYVVLDDLRGVLSEKFFQDLRLKPEEKKRERGRSETAKENYIFKTVARKNT